MKKGPTRKNFGVLSSRHSQYYILIGKFNPKMDTMRAFSPKSAYIFRFSRGQGRHSFPPLVARLLLICGRWCLLFLMS